MIIRFLYALKKGLREALVFLLILPIRFYQIFLSPLHTPCCRYTPTCSQYFILALKKYGPLIGTWKGIARILRCHPFHPGGEDWP